MVIGSAWPPEGIRADARKAFENNAHTYDHKGVLTGVVRVTRLKHIRNYSKKQQKPNKI